MKGLKKKKSLFASSCYWNLVFRMQTSKTTSESGNDTNSRWRPTTRTYSQCKGVQRTNYRVLGSFSGVEL